MSSIAFFPTFKRRFYFSKSLKGKLLLKQFYHPYNFLTRSFCLLWDRTPFLSEIFTANTENLPVNIHIIQSILGWKNIDFVLSGGSGDEKKTTGLFINSDTGEKVFFKYGSTAVAVKLVKNEIQILRTISLPIIPELLYSGEEPNLDVWFVTQVFEGFKYDSTFITQEIIDLILLINKVNYPRQSSNQGKLETAFAHGDFCPWNLVKNTDEKIKVIDWEMASVNLLGYDLFTFIFQSSFLLSPNKKATGLIKENLHWFKYYFMQFNIEDYLPYLKEFALIKFNKEKAKNKSELIEAYQNLLKTVSLI